MMKTIILSPLLACKRPSRNDTFKGPPPDPLFQCCAFGRCRGASIGIKNAQISNAKEKLISTLKLGGTGVLNTAALTCYVRWAFFYANGGTNFMLSVGPRVPA